MIPKWMLKNLSQVKDDCTISLVPHTVVREDYSIRYYNCGVFIRNPCLWERILMVYYKLVKP